jgi:PAS domain S-box-containing protein
MLQLAIKQLEKETQHKNAVETAILESIGDGIIVADSAGLVTFVNAAFERLTGWHSHEVIGRGILGILPDEDAASNTARAMRQILQEVLRGNEFIADVNEPYYTKRKDGTRFPASAIMTPVRLHGSVIGVVKTFRDITKEITIDRAKTEFVSLASHQLRSPLSAINWYTEMLLAGDVGPLTQDQEKYLTEVYRGNQRMIQLVSALLDVTRMSLGTFVLQPELIDLVDLVSNVVTEQQQSITQKKINLTTIFEPYIPIIESDAKLLRMVVQNLISNAIKYTDVHGRIELSLCLDTDSNHYLFSVSDTGCGIPKRQHEQIFNRLFRADNVRAKEIEGTGLGLYIAKAIIENSGGRIWFESEENVGSTFHIELPLGKK